MYRLLGGLIFAVANTASLSLNFYPILGELGSVSDRLSKMCGWSPNLFKILKEHAQPMAPSLNNPEEIQDWYRSIGDDEMIRNLRLFTHQFVPIPANLFSSIEQKVER